MSPHRNLWHLGAQFMASIQARDNASAQRQLKVLLELIAEETPGQFSYFKLRALQVMTNANRAAFTAGASTELLANHSRQIIAQIDKVRSKAPLVALTGKAVAKTISLVPKVDAYQDRKVQETIAYIKAHYTELITREELAARLQCSPAHFSRLFAKATGYPFKDFLLQYRLEKAKDLLKHSHLQVAEIANAVGYQDPFQFTKMFRKRLGVTPRQFRGSQIGATAPSLALARG